MPELAKQFNTGLASRMAPGYDREDEPEFVPMCAYDPEMWFSENKEDIAYAVKLCQDCPLIAVCAKLGETETWGVWGGISRGPVDDDTMDGKQRRNHGIRVEREAGMAVPYIMQKFGVSKNTVYLALKGTLYGD